MIAGLLLDWLLPSRYASYAGGVFAGGLLILIVELEPRTWAGCRESPRRRTESSLLRRAAGAALAHGAAGPATRARRVRSSRRSSLPRAGRSWFSFRMKGEFDPTRAPRQRDSSTGGFRPALSPGGSRGRGSAELCASGFRGASYPAKNRPGRSSSKPSWFWSLRARRPGPGDSRSPGLRDIETSLDGRKSPLSIEPGGQLGEVAIPRAGNHVLVIRRSFTTKSEAGFEVLSFPVNAIASARVVVDRPEPGKAGPGARGERRNAGFNRTGPWPAGSVLPRGSSFAGQRRRALGLKQGVGERGGVDSLGYHTRREIALRTQAHVSIAARASARCGSHIPAD